MTDRAPPKKKKTTKKEKPLAKKVGPKLIAADLKGLGHNSGQVIPGLVKIVDELLAIHQKKQDLGVAERTLRNRAKSEFGVLSSSLAHEMRLQKMDRDVRDQFEQSHRDIKIALGVQTEMEFLKAGEAEQIKPNLKHAHQPGFTVEEPAEETADEGVDLDEHGSSANVISREG